MLNRRASCRGVTAIELAVVLAIIGILIATVLPAYGSFMANQRIRTVAESYRSGLQFARLEALRRGANVFIDLGNLDSTWQVGCEIADANDNDNDGLADCPTLIRNESSAVDNAANTINVAVTGGTRATFSNLGLVRLTNLDNSGPFTQIDVTATGIEANGLRPLRVLLPAGGLSRVCDPSINTAGDTRLC